MLEVMLGSVPEAMPESQASVKRALSSGKELMFVQVELFNSGTEALEIKPGQFSVKDSSCAEVKTFGTRGVLQGELPGLDLKRLGARVEQLDLDEHELLATGQGTLHARLTLWHRFGHTSEHHLQHRERRWTRTRKSERTGSGGWPSARGTGS